MRVFLGLLPMYYAQQIDDWGRNTPPDPNKPAKFQKDLIGLDGTPLHPFEFSYTERKNPILSVTWGQREPYNDQAKLINGMRAPAGCVTTAVAQLMSSHGQPKEYGDLELDWGLLKNMQNKKQAEADHAKAVSMVATLFRRIADDLNVTWGADGTGAHSDRAMMVLREHGFIVPRGMEKFYKRDIVASLRSGRVVYMEGFDGVEGGHAWLIDGFYRRVTERGWLSEGGRTESMEEYSRDYFHCNWGWSGRHNGYCLAGVFNATESKVSVGDSDKIFTPHLFPRLMEAAASKAKPALYQYKLRMGVDIHPKR